MKKKKVLFQCDNAWVHLSEIIEEKIHNIMKSRLEVNKLNVNNTKKLSYLTIKTEALF